MPLFTNMDIKSEYIFKILKLSNYSSYSSVVRKYFLSLQGCLMSNAKGKKKSEEFYSAQGVILALPSSWCKKTGNYEESPHDRCWNLQQLLLREYLWKVGSLIVRYNASSFLWEPLFLIVSVCVCMHAQLCLTLCGPMDYSLPGSSVHGILQARKLEWIAIPFSRKFPDPGIEPMFPGFPALAGRFFTPEPPGKPLCWSIHWRRELGYQSMAITQVWQKVLKVEYGKIERHVKISNTHYTIWLVTSVQSLSCVRLFSTPWIAARQDSLSITNSRSSLRLTSIESVMPSSHLILCRPLLLLPPIPASESFPMSQLFAWGGQRTGVSALASFPPKKSQGLSPSEETGWISLQSKGLSRVFSNTTVQKHQFFSTQLSPQSNSHIYRWLLEKP